VNCDSIVCLGNSYNMTKGGWTNITSYQIVSHIDLHFSEVGRTIVRMTNICSILNLPLIGTYQKCTWETKYLSSISKLYRAVGKGIINGNVLRCNK